MIDRSTQACIWITHLIILYSFLICIVCYVPICVFLAVVCFLLRVDVYCHVFSVVAVAHFGPLSGRGGLEMPGPLRGGTKLPV